MKKIAIFAALMGVFGSVQASGLSIVGPNGGTVANPYGGYDGQPFDITGASNAGVIGNLNADVAGSIIFTYLGQESGNKNRFILQLGDGPDLKFIDNNGGGTTTQIGAVIGDSTVAAGIVSFKFKDSSNGTVVVNGSNPAGNGLKFAFLGNNTNSGFQFDQLADGTLAAPYNFQQFDYIIGFNDVFGDNDYDDLVVGVNFRPSAVPVPAALPLMATALGLFGFGASRRRV